MKKVILMSMVLAIFAFGFIGCEDNSTNDTVAPVTAKAVYVLNVIGTTISVIDLETGTVTNDLGTLGLYPNQILYYGGKVYVVNSGSSNIQVFDPENNFAEGTPIDLGTGKGPMNMVFYSDDIAFVACSYSNQVLKVNVTTGTVVATMDAGTGTTGICIANGKVYATNTGYTSSGYETGTVTVIDPVNATVVTTIDVNLNPQAIAVAPDGKVHVVCTGDWGATESGSIAVIDPTSNTVTASYDVGGTPGSISMDETNGLGYLGVWGMGAIVYNLSDGTVVNGVDDMFYGVGGSGILADPEGNVFISNWNDDQVAELGSDGVVMELFDVGDSPGSLSMKTGQ
jgi:DNA-binding beta-propeller fold protein YncE